MLNIYLYSVTAVTLSVFYGAVLFLVSGLLRWLFGLDVYEARGTVANGLGFALVSAPLWALHWNWLRRQFTAASGRATTAHRFYLFTVVCLNAMAVMVAGSLGLTGLMRLLLDVESGPRTGVTAGVALVACGLSIWLWLLHWSQLRHTVGTASSPQPANSSP